MSSVLRPGPRAGSVGEPGLAVADLSGQPDHVDGASEASASERALALVEPRQAQARGYRSQSLSYSSACLINGTVVTCSLWSRSAVLT